MLSEVSSAGRARVGRAVERVGVRRREVGGLRGRAGIARQEVEAVGREHGGEHGVPVGSDVGEPYPSGERRLPLISARTDTRRHDGR